MKILGVFSFIFGLGLLAVAVFGCYAESQEPSTYGVLAIILLVVSGLSVILFVVGTFSRSKIYLHSRVTDNIIDLPDHIVEEEQAHGISPFVIGCGIVSMIAGSLLLLYSTYSGYRLIRSSYYFGREFRIENLINAGFFICSLLLLVYCIRKLFFSRK